LTAVLLGLSLAAILLAVLLPPTSPLGKADLVGYAICHRIPERSFILGGRQLPLCARCTGTFLGVVLGLGWLAILRRGRAAHLPPPLILAVLVVWLGLWAFDGLNSYLTFFPGVPTLYEPQNWLRMTTGLLQGLALLLFVFPIFNFTLWSRPAPVPVIRNIWELAALVPAVVVLVVVTQAEPDFLLYPLALTSSLGAVTMLLFINSMLAAVLLRREGYARTWRQILVPLSVGLALAILEIVALVLLRDYITGELGVLF
jgi:uncharacterized membrane protein